MVERGRVGVEGGRVGKSEVDSCRARIECDRVR